MHHPVLILIVTKIWIFLFPQALFQGVVQTCENGGKRQPIVTQLGYTKEQIDAIHMLKNAKSDFERLGVKPGSQTYETVSIF